MGELGGPSEGVLPDADERRAEERSAQDSRPRWWLQPDAFADFGTMRGVRIEECEYLGGWQPEKARGDTLEIGPVGFTYGVRAFSPTLIIPWEQVVSVVVDGSKQATRPPVTGRRLVRAWATGTYGALGVLAKEKWSRLAVGTTDGSEALFQASGLLAHQLKAKLDPILRHYPGPQAVETVAVSSIDQIRQLAELRDSGILTDAEFQEKKAELLGRV